ncbi:hypothetical protein HF998_04750, partial [Cellulomonas hominis]|nr:hypothetical protein [Cellulomonas hominis]
MPDLTDELTSIAADVREALGMYRDLAGSSQGADTAAREAANRVDELIDAQASTAEEAARAATAAGDRSVQLEFA